METLIVHPKSRKQLATVEAILKALDVSFKKEEKDTYNPDFVASVLENYEKAKKGEVVTIEDPKNIWPSILQRFKKLLKNIYKYTTNLATGVL